MALNLITNPPTVPTISPDHWTDFVVRSDATMKGVDYANSKTCLTNWDTGTSKPEICQGSIFEVGGSFYEADSDTTLTDDAGIIDGAVHIKLVPNVGGTQVIPTLTSDDIPEWDSTKYGWYDGNDKFLPVEMTRSGAITKVFSSKFEYTNKNKINKLYSDGGIYIGGSAEMETSVISPIGSFETVYSTILQMSGFKVTSIEVSPTLPVDTWVTVGTIPSNTTIIPIFYGSQGQWSDVELLNYNGSGGSGLAAEDEIRLGVSYSGSGNPSTLYYTNDSSGNLRMKHESIGSATLSGSETRTLFIFLTKT
jgi:hypothetical protein